MATLIQGDCLTALKNRPDNSIDACVTDPPYGWRFMGKAWDGKDIDKMAKKAIGKEPRLCADGKIRKPREDCKSIAAGKYDQSLTGNQSFQIWTSEWAREIYRVLKPGGHVLIFCGPRTYHRMACGIEDAGFEIRDQLQWLFGSGFPKSHNIGKKLKDWDGFGTALKPSNEPIVLARKPLSEKTVVDNVLKWGTGGLNIDGCRIEAKDQKNLEKNWDRKTIRDIRGNAYGHGDGKSGGLKNVYSGSQGRWPANTLFDYAAAQMLDEQSGPCKTGDLNGSPRNDSNQMFRNKSGPTQGKPRYFKSDAATGASRFFYVAKASKRERGDGNGHPTVKPIKLMQYLCRLITPPKGSVLDPFMGSGTTGIAAKKEGFKFYGIEIDKEYFKIAKRRIKNGSL